MNPLLLGDDTLLSDHTLLAGGEVVIPPGPLQPRPGVGTDQGVPSARVEFVGLSNGQDE